MEFYGISYFGLLKYSFSCIFRGLAFNLFIKLFFFNIEDKMDKLTFSQGQLLKSYIGFLIQFFGQLINFNDSLKKL